jgi:hypothetical protein
MRGRIGLAVDGLAGAEGRAVAGCAVAGCAVAGSAGAGSAGAGAAALPAAPALHTALAISAMANPSRDDRFPIVGR